MKELTLERMEQIEGGMPSLGCNVAIGTYIATIAGVGILTGGIGAFLLVQATLIGGAAGMYFACS